MSDSIQHLYVYVDTFINNFNVINILNKYDGCLIEIDGTQFCIKIIFNEPQYNQAMNDILVKQDMHIVIYVSQELYCKNIQYDIQYINKHTLKIVLKTGLNFSVRQLDYFILNELNKNFIISW